MNPKRMLTGLPLLICTILIFSHPASAAAQFGPVGAAVEDGGSEIGLYTFQNGMAVRVGFYRIPIDSPVVRGIKMMPNGIVFTDDDGNVAYVPYSEFTASSTAPITQRSRLRRPTREISAEIVLAELSHSGTDVDATCDGRFLVTCGEGVTPVSVVDFATMTEISTLTLPNPCVQIVCGDDDSTVLVIEKSTETNRELGVRRLVLSPTGQLSDSGEFLAIPDVRGLYIAPGSVIGIAQTFDLNPDLAMSFTVQDMVQVDAAPLNGSLGVGCALNCAGDRLFTRSGGTGIDPDLVEVFALDSATGAIGNAPLLSFPITILSQRGIGEELIAVDPETSHIVVLGETDNPFGFAMQVYDSTTGALLDEDLDIPNPRTIVFPSCCLTTPPPTGATLTSELVAGPDRDNNQVIDTTIPVRSRTSSEYSFTVALDGAGATAARVTDTIPREWEIVEIVSDDPADPIQLFPGRFFPASLKPYLSTNYTWTPSDSAGVLTVTVRTRAVRWNQFQPNRPGTYPLNSGAEGLQSDGSPLLDGNGQPLVGPIFTVTAE